MLQFRVKTKNAITEEAVMSNDYNLDNGLHVSIKEMIISYSALCRPGRKKYIKVNAFIFFFLLKINTP